MSEDYKDLVKNYLENGGKITQGKPMKRTKRISLKGKVGFERFLLEDTYETDDRKKGNVVL
tara:strand:+ start:144 stop:326 length:183 start_codon:yes stop_codon:yes gene_type:complete